MNRTMYKNYLIAYYYLSIIKDRAPEEFQESFTTIINYLRTSISNYKLRSTSKLRTFAPSSLSLNDLYKRTYFVLECLFTTEYQSEAKIIQEFIKSIMLKNRIIEGELKR